MRRLLTRMDILVMPNGISQNDLLGVVEEGHELGLSSPLIISVAHWPRLWTDEKRMRGREQCAERVERGQWNASSPTLSFLHWFLIMQSVCCGPLHDWMKTLCKKDGEVAQRLFDLYMRLLWLLCFGQKDACSRSTIMHAVHHPKLSSLTISQQYCSFEERR